MLDYSRLTSNEAQIFFRRPRKYQYEAKNTQMKLENAFSLSRNIKTSKTQLLKRRKFQNNPRAQKFHCQKTEKGDLLNS